MTPPATEASEENALVEEDYAKELALLQEGHALSKGSDAGAPPRCQIRSCFDVPTFCFIELAPEIDPIRVVHAILAHDKVR